MLRDITLGQYYQTESLIHKMDPRVKLGGTVLFIISLFFFKNYAGYVIAALFLGLVIRLSKVPFKFMVKGMKTIVMLMLITVVFNLFLTPGTPLITIWKLTITQEGLKMAISMAIRLTLLIIGSSVMTLTTTPNNLTDGMEKMMGPLKVCKVPVHEVAMMMSIALRFIPILLEETDHESTDRQRCGFRERQHFQACQSHGAPAGTAVYLRVPQSQRPCHGNGGQMLSRRRGQDEDETADLS